MSRGLYERMIARVRTSIFFVFQRARVLVYRAVSPLRTAGHQARLMQPTLFLGKGTVKIGADVQFGYFPSPEFLTGACHVEARAASARIEIGDGCFINNGFTAIAETTSIVIGKRCLVGPGVVVFDSDFHGMRINERNDTNAIARAPVHIGDDVFIGTRAIILKGVSIGDGAVIAAGSVAVRSIPGGVIAGGNPARVLKEI